MTPGPWTRGSRTWRRVWGQPSLAYAYLVIEDRHPHRRGRLRFNLTMMAAVGPLQATRKHTRRFATLEAAQRAGDRWGRVAAVMVATGRLRERAHPACDRCSRIFSEAKLAQLCCGTGQVRRIRI